MKNISRAKIGLFAIICLSFSLGSVADTRARSQAPSTVQKEKKMTVQAKGTFEVKMTPAPPDDKSGTPAVGRFTLDKQFQGDIDGFSKGEMLAFSTSVKDSAVYVAIEQVTGKLNGRTGTFALHHTGVMNRGTPSLTINVAPDSGTGELVGISGRMTIEIKDGKHFYEFEYTIP